MSAKTQYAERRKAGRIGYMFWMTAEEHARLRELEEASGMSRRDILGGLIESSSLIGFAPGGFHNPPPRAQAPRHGAPAPASPPSAVVPPARRSAPRDARPAPKK